MQLVVNMVEQFGTLEVKFTEIYRESITISSAKTCFCRGKRKKLRRKDLRRFLGRKTEQMRNKKQKLSQSA